MRIGRYLLRHRATDRHERDRLAMARLLRFFHRRKGRWRTPTGEAWQPALAIEAVINAYEHTGDPTYLDEAEALFVTMTRGWDDVCGGGLWWNADRGYKNAITNELFLLAAARLHRRAPHGTGPGSYLDWALREWEWFGASGMINADHQVNDGLDASCANNGGPTWTYNQGVILGGLARSTFRTPMSSSSATVSR